MKDRKVKVAAVQAAPVLPMDKKATTEKACRLIEEAGREGAQLVVFPECYIPMFPNWSIDLSRPSEWSDLIAELTVQSVEIPSEETDMLCAAARKAGAYVCMGLNERHKQFKSMIYNCLLFIGPDGEILGRHRKFTPSHRERVFHGRGDGTDLSCVFDTNIGKIGGLICYEHLQPLFKYALFAQGEEIHCACWPGGWPHFPPPGRSNKEVMQIASRACALEGACFVVVASTHIPEKMSEVAGLGNAHWGFPGGSAVVNPNGNYVAGPVFDEETIVYATIDLYDVTKRKVYIDVVGRDARWDVIKLAVNRQAYTPWAPEAEAEVVSETLAKYISSVDHLADKMDELMESLSKLGKGGKKS